eukprot:Colp12_sorted_trinity150504_noHs@19983
METCQTQTDSFQKEIASQLTKIFDWYSESESHESARLCIRNGVAEYGVHTDKSKPGMASSDNKNFVPVDELLHSDAANELCAGHNIELRKWIRVAPNRLTTDFAVVFERPLNEMQKLDVQDYDHWQDLQRHLYQKLFPWWRDRRKEASWHACSSTDQLSFFVEWLLLFAPLEKTQLFLDLSLDDIHQEVESNIKLYTDDEGFLMNEDVEVKTEGLRLFRQRFPSRCSASFVNSENSR